MEIGSIFLLFGIGILALAFLLRPFFLEQLKLVTPSKRAAAYPEDAECITLREEQNRLIQSVHDLDFDHKLGKVADDIYRDQRKELVAQGSAILKRMQMIDCIDGENIRSRQKSSTRLYTKHVYDRSDELEEMIAQHRRKQSERSMGFCTQCGTPYKRSDRFCSQCGHELDT